MHEFSFGVNFVLVFPKRFKSGKKKLSVYPIFPETSRSKTFKIDFDIIVLSNIFQYFSS